MSPAPALGDLPEAMRERLGAGEHEQVATQLEAAGDHVHAALVREQIWDFAGAYAAWRRAGDPIRALRAALETNAASMIDAAVAAFAAIEDRLRLREAATLLAARRRHHDAAMLLARCDDAPDARARELLRAGDRVGAARVLASAGDATGALRALGEIGDGPTSGPGHALAAKLSWDLGDAEAAARHAQSAWRVGTTDEEVRSLLSRALATLGHDLAAEIVLPQRARGGDSVPGRFRVTAVHAGGLGGAAYLGVDRTDLHEVEIHLLLADLPDPSAAEHGVLAALERFAAVARAASTIGHPAIRPVLELRAAEGLVVLPRAQGPTLRSLIRPPGMADMRSRARALVAFLLEGLGAAHDRGLVHGWLLPSQIVCDALGRPQLGPFGAHHLAGLAATHTGSLEEILAVTAPEVRGGSPPTPAADLYATGALLAALLTGELGAPCEGTSEEEALARQLLAADAEDRPSATEALAVLRAPVAHVRELAAGTGSGDSQSALTREPEQLHGVVVDAAMSWSDAELDALGASAQPWWQPILDRRGRQFVLAPWPPGSRALGPATGDAWRAHVPSEALDVESELLRGAIEARLQPTSLVATAADEWMIALDDLLSR